MRLNFECLPVGFCLVLRVLYLTFVFSLEIYLLTDLSYLSWIRCINQTFFFGIYAKLYIKMYVKYFHVFLIFAALAF